MTLAHEVLDSHLNVERHLVVDGARDRASGRREAKERSDAGEATHARQTVSRILNIARAYVVNSLALALSCRRPDAVSS
jgi:hypothetical protein